MQDPNHSAGSTAVMAANSPLSATFSGISVKSLDSLQSPAAPSAVRSSRERQLETDTWRTRNASRDGTHSCVSQRRRGLVLDGTHITQILVHYTTVTIRRQFHQCSGVSGFYDGLVNLSDRGAIRTLDVLGSMTVRCISGGVFFGGEGE